MALRGRNIAETLDLTVDAALEVFADEKRLCRRLRTLAEVGLGYLRLGQPTATLSGGEAQRLKLASFLDRPPARGARGSSSSTSRPPASTWPTSTCSTARCAD